MTGFSVGSWADVPLDRVVRLVGAGAETIRAALEPLPADGPAVVTYRPAADPSSAVVVAHLLDALDAVTTRLFPVWLPGAEPIGEPGGLGTAAVRILAARSAAATPDFGPFLADLAERSLTGGKPAGERFPAQVRAVGLVRVIATSYGRTRVALLVEVPDGLTPARGRALLAACEWFAHHGRAGVWLTGAVPPTFGDRVRAAAVPAPGPATPPAAAPDHDDQNDDDRNDGDDGPAVSLPAVAGKPRPDSLAERSLERALAARPWSAGRAWNQIHDLGPLVGSIRVDLMWAAERCVVEVDGPDHRGRKKYADDRQRDLRLALGGYTVLRFTNEQVIDDPEAVLRPIRCFIEPRRRGQREEQHSV